MKNLYRTFCWAAFFLFAGGTAALAQEYTPVPVTVSRMTTSMNGQTYYMHIVLARQTLYGICKAYEVTEEDLYAANPTLQEEGLKAGTVIYIPAHPAGKSTAQEKAAKTAKTEKAVKTEKTVKTEPVTKTEPVVKREEPVPVQPDEDGYIHHTVKWFENINDVAKTYGVTAQQIMDANGLKSSRISKRQVLRIPVNAASDEPVIPAPQETALAEAPVQTQEIPVSIPVETTVTTPEKTVAETVVETVSEPEPTPVENTAREPLEDGLFGWLTGKGSVEMALLLPFNAAGSPSESNMDFYSGVLMALRDLEAEDVKSTLHVYDLKAGVPSAAELNKSDFILGPISTKDLTTVLESTGGQTPVISPLDQRALSLTGVHEGFIQAPASVDSQYADLAAWVAEDRVAGDRIILISEKTSSGSTAPAVGIREALMADGTPFEDVSWTLSAGRSLPSALTAQLTKSGVNRIVVASEGETFVGDVVRNLSILMGRGYRIVMYAPSKVRTFETADGSLYHQCNLHICSPYFADYDTQKVKDFVRSYRALFRTEPSQFAFQGYDLTRFFAGICAKYGYRWTQSLDRVTGTGLHTDFRFVPCGGDSFRNTGIRRIVYNTDYSTGLVK